MPTINGRHFYRFKYLKSEHWQNLRLEKLVEVDACCFRCGMRDLSNDVHHVNYRKLFDVTLADLVVLCRRCHTLMHDVLKAVEDGGFDAVQKLLSRLRADREGFRAQPRQLNEIFKTFRKEGLLKPKPVIQPPKKKKVAIPPPVPIVRAKRSSLFDKEKMRKGFHTPDTKPLFIALRRVGYFIAEPVLL